MFQQIFFIVQVCSIFMVETIKYNLFGTNIIKNLTYKLAKVNILCIKIFQAISLNINKSINDELIKYTDHVPYSFYKDIDFDTNSVLFVMVIRFDAMGVVDATTEKILKTPAGQPRPA